MSGTSGLDFASVGQELTYWLTHVAKSFMGGYPGSGENGYDFSMPEGTPVYAILPGTVVGAGKYGGGGVVSVQYNSQNVIYYQHLSANQVQVGQQIVPGQQIGLSGGLTNIDGQPVSCCSSFPHIEVGINAPFGGIWNPNNVQPNANPIGLFNSLNSQYQANDVAVGGSGGKYGGYITGLSTGTGSTSSTPQAGNWCFSVVGNQVCIPVLRMGKMILGGLIITFAVLLFVIPTVASPILKGAGVVTGQPALVGVGAALSGKSKQERAQSRNQAAFSAAQTRQRSNEVKRAATTRNLGSSGTPSSGEAAPQPSLKKQGFHGGTTSEREESDKAAGIAPKATPVGMASTAPPTTPPTVERGQKTSLNLPRYSGARRFRTHEPVTIDQLTREVREANQSRQAQLEQARKARESYAPRGQRTSTRMVRGQNVVEKHATSLSQLDEALAKDREARRKLGKEK